MSETSHICRVMDDAGSVLFCYPPAFAKNSRYYLAVNPAGNPDERKDVDIAEGLLGRLMRPPLKIAMPPKDIYKKAPAWRVYDITNTIPNIILNRLWRGSPYPGPNCYQAALCASGFRHVCDRYVDSKEAAYLLRNFFKPVANAECETKQGSINVFYEHIGMMFAPIEKTFAEVLDPKKRGLRHAFIPTKQEAAYNKDKREKKIMFGMAGYDTGTHMAISVGGGLVYHKLSYHWNDLYRIDPITKAMEQVWNAAYTHMDPFEARLEKELKKRYTMNCYRLSKNPATLYNFSGASIWENPKRSYYLYLFRSYSTMISEIEKSLTDESRKLGILSERFDKERLSLLSIENIWRLLAEFNKDIGYVKNQILDGDPELAIAYYTLESYRWEYQAMSDTYYRITERDDIDKKLRSLYEKHYLKFDFKFKKEILAHLKARGIEQGADGARYKKIITAVLMKLKKYNPLDYYKSNGSKGIPFYEILEEAIAL